MTSSGRPTPSRRAPRRLALGALIAALALASSRASAQAAAPPAAAAPAVRITPDRSLTAAEYAAAGLPPVDHPWTHAEITAAARALTTLVAGDVSRLPREGSARSGAVFSRFVDVARVDPAAPMSMDDEFGYLGALTDVLRLYVTDTTRGFMDAETVALTDVLLALSARSIASALPRLTEHASRALSDDGVFSGFRRMVGGFDETAHGAVTMLFERDHFRPAVRTRLVAVLRARLPSVTSHLAPDQRNVLRLRVEHVARDERPDALVPALRALAAAL